MKHFSNKLSWHLLEQTSLLTLSGIFGTSPVSLLYIHFSMSVGDVHLCGCLADLPATPEDVSKGMLAIESRFYSSFFTGTTQ